MKLTHVEAAILVGGLSSRMGRDKARLEVGGTPLVGRVAHALGQCVERVRLVARPGEPLPLPLEGIVDGHSQRAPMVGVAAALAACESAGVLVAACDLPDVSPRLVLALLALFPAVDGPDIVAPAGPRGLEPLLAVYRPTLLPEVERRIAAGDLALQALLRDSNTLAVPESELRAVDPDLASLRNLNRPEDVPV